jgi:uncharacterized protein YjbI with pentapeptide repeats
MNVSLTDKLDSREKYLRIAKERGKDYADKKDSLVNSDLSRSRLLATTFTENNFNHLALVQAKLTKVTLNRCLQKDSEVSKTVFEGSNFKSCNLSDCQFISGHFKDVVFESCNFSGIKLDHLEVKLEV